MVFTDSRVIAIVPMVHPANEVLSINVSVRKQRATMKTPAVQYRNLVIVSNDYQIHIPDQRVNRLSIFQFAKYGNLNSSHVLSFLSSFRLVCRLSLIGLGNSSHVRPSSSRPVRFLFTPPHCLKKTVHQMTHNYLESAAPILFHRSCPRARLTSYNHPVDPRKFQVWKRPE